MQKRSEMVWREWNALDDEEPSPVKAIARKLDMSTGDVARIVYPPSTFGEWEDWQEPPLPGETESRRDRKRRQLVDERARRFEVDDDIRRRALGYDA